MNLSELRRQIDDIDQQIVELLAKRLSLVKSIAELKHDYGLGINDEVREVDVSIKWRKLAAAHGVPLDFVEQVLRTILSYSKKLQVDTIKSIDKCEGGHNVVVAVVGYGRMGKALGLQIVRNGFNAVITGKDIKKARAISEELGCNVADIERALTVSSYVVLALPPHAYQNGFVDSIVKHMAGKVVMDILSSKGWIYRYLEKLSYEYGFSYVSTHPLFGPSTPAFGQKIVIIPSETGKNVLESIVSFWRCVGLDPIVASYEEHEKAMAIVQVLAHLHMLVFQLGVEELSKELGVDPMKFSTPTFKELMAVATRLNEIKDVIYEIQKNNTFSPLVHDRVLRTLQNVVSGLGGRK